jgi:hypothetical protein
LNLERKDVERAVKVASISSEAKKAARVAGLDDNRTALLAVAKEATPAAQVAKVGAISSAKTAAKAKNLAFEPKALKKSGDVTDPPLRDEVIRFAEFCRANWPASVAVPGEFAEMRVRIAEIREWLGQFLTALGDGEATDIAAKGPGGPDVVPPAKHEPLAAASDIWRDLDIPTFLDRRGKAPDKKGLPNRGNS